MAFAPKFGRDLLRVSTFVHQKKNGFKDRRPRSQHDRERRHCSTSFGSPDRAARDGPGNPGAIPATARPNVFLSVPSASVSIPTAIKTQPFADGQRKGCGFAGDLSVDTGGCRATIDQSTHRGGSRNASSAGTGRPSAAASSQSTPVRRSRRATTLNEWLAPGPAPGRRSSRADMPLSNLRGSPPGPADLRVRPPAGASDPVAREPIEPDKPVGDTRDLDGVVRTIGPLAGPVPHAQMVTDPAHGG